MVYLPSSVYNTTYSNWPIGYQRDGYVMVRSSDLLRTYSDETTPLSQFPSINTASCVVTVSGSIPEPSVKKKTCRTPMELWVAEKFKMEPDKQKPMTQTMVRTVRKQFTSMLFPAVIQSRRVR